MRKLDREQSLVCSKIFGEEHQKEIEEGELRVARAPEDEWKERFSFRLYSDARTTRG